MAVTGVTNKPKIVHLGNATESRYDYTTGGVDTIAVDDLVRINSSGTLDLAESASAGAVHGIALEGDGGTAKQIAIVKFASDTLVQIQCIDGESPADLALGEEYTLEVTAGSPAAITATTTNGVALVVSKAGTAMPWTDTTGTYDEATGTDNNSVIVRFTDATLGGNAAAAS